MKKCYSFVMLLTLISILVLGACGKSDSTSGKDNSSEELTTIKVAYQPNFGGASAFVIGDKKGYFEKAGLKVEPTLFQTGPEMMAALSSGQLDFGYVGTGPLNMPLKGMATVLTIDLFNLNDGLIVDKDSGIKEVSDLKGKNILVPLGTTGHVALSEYLKTEGLTLEDIEEINTNPSETVTSFTTGKAPAAVGWSPTTDSMLEKREGSFTLISDYDLPEQVKLPSVWAASNSLIKKDPELAKRFTWAILKSMEYRNDNMDETIKLVSDYIDVSEELNQSFADQTEFPDPYEMVDQFGDGTVEPWFDNLATTFEEMGLIESIPEFSSYTNVELLEEAKELDLE